MNNHSDGIIRAPDYRNSAVEKLPIQLQADGIYGKPKNELLPQLVCKRHEQDFFFFFFFIRKQDLQRHIFCRVKSYSWALP